MVHREPFSLSPAAAVPWPQLSPRGEDLFRRGAELALDPRADWVEELHAAALGGHLMRAVASDPDLAAATRRSNLMNLLNWAGANVQRPGRRVPVTLGPEVLETARDLVRRGLDSSALDAYRTGQSVAWRRWMQICFTLTTDPTELRELLDVSALSISTFVDDTVAALTERMDAERDALTRGAHAERRAIVTLLLEGAPIPRARAEAQLGYALGGPHTAAVVRSVTSDAADHLEAAAEAVMRAAGAGRRLTVVASAATVWIWLPVAQAPSPEGLDLHPDVRLALGRPGVGIEGFRRSHLDANVAQRMLDRLTSPRQVARYADVHLVALLTADPGQAEEFVRDTLGDLARADEETRATVLGYVRAGCSASRAAQLLYTHRNTVLRRLARADELLPRPLATSVVEVAVALEVLHWRGTG